MNVAILLYDGFDNLDAIGPFEVFKQAERFGADLSVGLYTLEERAIVESNFGLRVEPDGTLPDHVDLVVVPGGGWGDRSEVGAWGEAERGDVPDAIAGLHEEGAMIAAVCTGGMLVARAGLTAGWPAITHESTTADLRESGARVVDARVVDAGDVVTAGGVTSGLDLALHLVEREFGADLAATIADQIEYERQGAVYRASAEDAA